MKRKLLIACLLSAAFSTQALAWDLWDEFKSTNVTEEGRDDFGRSVLRHVLRACRQ